MAVPNRSSREARILASVWVSTAERESSKMRMGASRSSALAMAARCFWPPERVTPRSPTKVSYPSLKPSMASVRQAAAEAFSTSARVAPAWPMAMLSAMERLKR